MVMPPEQIRRTDLAVPATSTAVGAGPPAASSEWLSAMAALFQQAANGTGTPGPLRIDIPTASSINVPRPPVHRNTAPGYTAQHTFFQHESTRQQAMAYARNVDHKGSVKGILCFHPDGKVKCQTIGVSNDHFRQSCASNTSILSGKRFLWTPISHMQS